MINWKSALVFAGVGSFLGFLIAVLLYEPLKNESMVYLIVVGLAVGALLSTRFEVELEASSYAFLLGIFTALILVLLWVPGKAGMAPLYIALGVTMGAMIYAKPAGLKDTILVPITYLGGFVLIMLVMKDYPPVRDNEYAVPVLFSAAGSATALAFFASLARWGFEFARKFAKSGRGNV